MEIDNANMLLTNIYITVLGLLMLDVTASPVEVGAGVVVTRESEGLQDIVCTLLVT